ncbi:hypothetical protein IAR55_005532 [Kwoniella newhampshirensis]|uniref:Uncharacterized protein n=1 Tax=Kwoniella newhampshirensis TaxID=1651941 RepID=A0AAW0YVS8_9TREE
MSLYQLSHRDTSLERISAVHPQILGILRTTSPTRLLAVSPEFYHDLIPSLYTDLSLTSTNVEGILHGLLDDSRQVRERKYAALECARCLQIADVRGLKGLARVFEENEERECLRLDDSTNSRDLEVGQLNLARGSPSPAGFHSGPFFPFIDTLYLPWALIQALTETIKDFPPIEDVPLELWGEVDGNGSDLDREDPANASLRCLGELATCGRLLARIIRCKTIEVQLGPAEDVTGYWNLDRTLQTLLGGFVADVATAGTSADGKSTCSPCCPKLRLNVQLPSRYEKVYIPHGLSMPATVHFIAPIPSLTVGVSNEALERFYTAREYAEVIRSHYDVHVSYLKPRDIFYHVQDVEEVMSELEYLRRHGKVVNDRLLRSEEQGGVLRQVDHEAKNDHV